MTRFQRRIQFCLVGIFLVSTSALIAQELGYSGLGSINHSVAGATAALPLDGSGAMHWNPATIGALEFGELQMGFGRINAPWYGDESAIYTVLAPVFVVGAIAVVALADEDDIEWWTSSSGKKDKDEYVEEEPPVEETPQLTDYAALPKLRRVRGFNFSFVMAPTRDRRWNLGLGVEETGSRKYRLQTHPETGAVMAVRTYRVKTTELTPTASYRISRRLYFGITPVLSFTEHPGASLPVLSGYEMTQDRSHFGFGLQLGVFYKTKRGFNFGLSVQSPHWTSSQSVQWVDADGNLLQRKLNYSTEQPMQYVFGISYTGFERLKLAVDVRLYDFQHLSSLYGVSGRKPMKRATSFATGLQFVPQPDGFPMSFRVGYQFNDVGGLWGDYYYNITPPITHGHSIHYGISFGREAQSGYELSVSLSHSFGGGSIRTETASGPRSFRRNPNDNALWWSFRYKY